MSDILNKLQPILLQVLKFYSIVSLSLGTLRSLFIGTTLDMWRSDFSVVRQSTSHSLLTSREA